MLEKPYHVTGIIATAEFNFMVQEPRGIMVLVSPTSLLANL